MRLEFEFCDGSKAVIEGDDLAGIAICHEPSSGLAGVTPRSTSQIRVSTVNLFDLPDDDPSWKMLNPQPTASRVDEPADAAADQPADEAAVILRPAAYDAVAEHDECEPGKQAVS